MSKRSKVLFGTKLLVLSFLIFYLSFSITKNYINNPSDYQVLENKDFGRKQVDLYVHTFKTQKELQEAVSFYVKDGIQREGFSVWGVNDNTCDIFVLEPTNEEDLNTWGHELAHCVYGRWHYTKK